MLEYIRYTECRTITRAFYPADEKKIQCLQKKKKRIRIQIFDMEDEIEEKRDELIDALEKRMNHEVEVDSLSTVKWEVV